MRREREGDLKTFRAKRKKGKAQREDVHGGDSTANPLWGKIRKGGGGGRFAWSRRHGESTQPPANLREKTKILMAKGTKDL